MGLSKSVCRLTFNYRRDNHDIVIPNVQEGFVIVRVKYMFNVIAKRISGIPVNVFSGKTIYMILMQNKLVRSEVVKMQHSKISSAYEAVRLKVTINLRGRNNFTTRYIIM